jgi:hypothetical protein
MGCRDSVSSEAGTWEQILPKQEQILPKQEQILLEQEGGEPRLLNGVSVAWEWILDIALEVSFGPWEYLPLATFTAVVIT